MLVFVLESSVGLPVVERAFPLEIVIDDLVVVLLTLLTLTVSLSNEAFLLVTSDVEVLLIDVELVIADEVVERELLLVDVRASLDWVVE